MDATTFTKLILLSMVTPMLCAVFLLKTFSDPNVRVSSCNLGWCCAKITISSVLLLFSFNLLAVIHLPISFTNIIHTWLNGFNRLISMFQRSRSKEQIHLCHRHTDGTWHHVHVKCLQEVQYVKHTRLGQGQTPGVHQSLDYDMKKYFLWCLHTV